MLLSILFVFTAGVTILNVFKLVSIMVGHSLDFPGSGIERPTHWIWFYPSALYQIWFWATHFAIV